MKKYIGKYKKEGLPGGPNEVETTINGFIITNEGQWKYPGQPTLIPSNEITMQGVGFPVLGIDDTGHSKMMMPGADYTFPGSMVYELPMAQSGKTVSQNWQEVTGTPWSKAKELGLTTGGADQNVELRKKFLANPEYYRNLAQGRQDVATVEPISVEQIYQPIASSISREDVPVQDQYRDVRQQEPENIIGRYNITPYGVEAAPYTISDPRLLQLPTMVTDFENDTEGSFIGEGSWNRLGAVPLTSATGEFAQEYFDPLTGEATGEFIPTLASSTLTASGPNAYMPDGSACAQKECAAGMQYNIVGHLEGGWDELKDKLGIRGDAWTINENILNSGGQRIYGLGTDMDINRSKKYSSNEVRKKLYEARKKHNLDAVYESAQVGDIVEMYYPNSSSQEEAIRTGKGDTYTTHVGHITEKDGVKYVTHNVDGTFHTDKLDTLLRRSGSRRSTEGTTVSGIIRPNYGWRDSQNGAVSISKKPVQAIAASGDRNYYITEDQESVSDWQLAAITPVAKQFVQGLESVAPDIAADFGLSNDQLSLIMKASFGAFGNESGFGQSNTYKKKERARRVIRGYKNIAPEWMPEGDEQSEGLSQIKLENAFNDPKAKALLKKYGIKDVEQLYDPMYSSIATMLLTAMNYKQFESATGLKAEDVDPITMQNIMLLAHNKGMQNVINNDFVEEGKFKKLHQLRRKGHKYVEGEEPKLSDQSILQGLATYADVHMNPDSYTNKTGDFAASLNIDMSRLFAEKGDREAYVGQEAPEAYGLGETLLDQAYGLLGDRDYSDDKEKLLAAMESAKIKAIKNAEKLYKGSKQKLRRALSQIERDSRKAINEIQNAGAKAVNRVRSTFEEGGDVSSKIYIGQYTMGPNKDLDNVEFKNGGPIKYRNGGPTDPPKKPPLTSSDFDYTTDRSRGNARFFSDPVTGEPLPLVNLPEVEIVETLNRDENGNIIFSGPEARDNYFAYKNLGEQGLRDMQAMKSGIRRTTGDFANTFLVPPAMVAGTVLGGAPLVGPVARGASFLNTALQAPMQFGSRTIPGVTGYNLLGASGAGVSINEFANPSSTTRRSIGRAIQDPTTGNILDASGNTLASGLGFVGIGAAKALGRQLSPLAKNAGKQLAGSRVASSVDDVGESLARFKNQFESGNAQRIIGAGGSRNKGIYEIDGKIVKLTGSGKGASNAEELKLLSERVKDMPNVHTPQHTTKVTTSDGKSLNASIMTKAPGKDASKLTSVEIENIPKLHWDKFEKDTRLLSERGIQTDFTKKNNLFYDEKSGFHFIDIGGASVDGTGTGKFFMKNGVEHYVPFEKYKGLPPGFSGEKPFTGGKDMFKNISNELDLIPKRNGGFVKYPNGDEQLLTAQFGGMRRGKVDRILDDNRDLNFVDRMYQPNTPSIMIPGQDSPSTHFMESADGRVYPTVVQMPDGSLQYLGANAYDYAMETGEYIEFPNDRQARRFAKSYKKGTGVLDEFSSGGLKQWFAEDWVDIKTGKKCGRGKDETGRPYPACRPSNRVNETTPKTSSEMSDSEKRKFRREKRSSKRISYNHKRNNR